MFVSLIDLISPTREYFFGCGVVISLERDEPTMDPCKSENWQMQEWTEYKFTGNTNKDITNIRKTVNDYIETIESTLEDIKNKQEQKQHAADCCNKQYARRLQVDP
jgi:Txe/YoeB family toxin of Txe-Axe toxin-antitoxin module